jgi:YebC/PmpR family DNA-binding regulatory protein
MAGHSKWANIKHRKGKADALKGKAFSRVTKEIISAVKAQGSDPKTNPKLRLALQKAKEVNLPNDNIERNIKKAISDDQSDYFDVTYELYGHGGVGLIIEALTDNKNRMASDMRIATNKRGGTIATPGSVAFNFEKKGLIVVSKNSANEEELFMLASEAGAEDFESDDENYTIVVEPSKLFSVKDALDQNNIKCQEADLMMIPKSYVEVDSENEKANLALIDWLEELDDVDAVYHNMQISEENNAF